jgi:type II secretory pathway pseudopilin PulG
VELLVVIAIIALLVALLLPAVNAAREAARRTQCTNHLKQFGLALVNYESTQGVLPPGRETTTQVGVGWSFRLLPYLEEAAVYEALDADARVDDEANRVAMRSPVAVMYCPSRRSPAADRDFDNNDAPSLVRGVAAGGDYAANAGLYGRYNTEPVPRIDGAIAGPLFSFSKIKTRQIGDGLSKTLGVGERHIPPPSTDDPGLMAHHQGDTAFFAGDNPRTILAGTIEGIAYSEKEPCPETPAGDAPCAFKFGGVHSGITLFVFLDGHVQPLQKDISLNIIHPLSTITDRQVITGFP